MVTWIYIDHMRILFAVINVMCFLQPTMTSRYMVSNIKKERNHSAAKSVGNVLRIGKACVIIRNFMQVRNSMSVMIVVNHIAIFTSFLDIRLLLANGHINVMSVIKHIQFLLH